MHFGAGYTLHSTKDPVIPVLQNTLSEGVMQHTLSRKILPVKYGKLKKHRSEYIMIRFSRKNIFLFINYQHFKFIQ